MPLRPHQEELRKKVFSIHWKHSNEKELFLFWAPGAGKSLAPPILSDLLVNNKKQIWVVPRDSLKEQGESDDRGQVHTWSKEDAFLEE